MYGRQYHRKGSLQIDSVLLNAKDPSQAGLTPTRAEVSNGGAIARPRTEPSWADDDRVSPGPDASRCTSDLHVGDQISVLPLAAQGFPHRPERVVVADGGVLN